MSVNPTTGLEQLKEEVCEAKAQLDRLDSENSECYSIHELNVRILLLQASQSILGLVNSLSGSSCPWRIFLSFLPTAKHPSFRCHSTQTIKCIDRVLGSFVSLEDAVTKHFNAVVQYSISLKDLQSSKVLSLRVKIEAVKGNVKKHVEESEKESAETNARLRLCEVEKYHVRQLQSSLEQSVADATCSADSLHKVRQPQTPQWPICLTDVIRDIGGTWYR